MSRRRMSWPSSRNRNTRARIFSAASAKGFTEAIWEPMWQATPTARMPGSEAASRYVASTRSAGMPNLLVERAVAMCGCVRASTSGFTRSATGATLFLRAAMRESCCSSSSLSQLNWKMPASNAAASSSCRLPTPEKTTLRASPPACSTRKSSPPETMSKPRPSRASNASKARFGAISGVGGRGGPLTPQTTSVEVARTMSARTRRLIGLEHIFMTCLRVFAQPAPSARERLERDRQEQAHRVRDGCALARGYVPEAVEGHEQAVGQSGVELVGGVVRDADVELEPERPRQPRRVLRIPGLRVHPREDQLEARVVPAARPAASRAVAHRRLQVPGAGHRRDQVPEQDHVDVERPVEDEVVDARMAAGRRGEVEMAAVDVADAGRLRRLLPGCRRLGSARPVAPRPGAKPVRALVAGRGAELEAEEQRVGGEQRDVRLQGAAHLEEGDPAGQLRSDVRRDTADVEVGLLVRTDAAEVEGDLRVELPLAALQGG